MNKDLKKLRTEPITYEGKEELFNLLAKEHNLPVQEVSSAWDTGRMAQFTKDNYPKTLGDVEEMTLSSLKSTREFAQRIPL